MKRPIVIAGGGTGGHVFVAEAVADALIATGERPGSLAYVGSRRGQEKVLLAGSAIPLTLLPGRGIKRSLAPRDILKNFGAVAGLVAGIGSLLIRFASWKPRAVVSVGGYAALAAGVAAAIWRRPLILVNIDAVPGSTHRFLARFASASCVISPSTPLPNPIVTGAPVRAEFEEVDRSREARSEAKIALGADPERPLLAVVTGSLGARSVNMAVVALAERWRDRSLTIYHVTGERDREVVSAMAPDGAMALDYKIVEFESRMSLLYQASDLVLCRAGALTVAEIALVGLCAVLVPLPGAPGDHQTKNAEAMVDLGAGTMISDPALTSDLLDEVLSALLSAPERRDQIERAAQSLGRPRAAAAVAKVVKEYA